jgi:hypothetical protein
MGKVLPGLSIEEAQYVSDLENNNDPKIEYLLKTIERLRKDVVDCRTRNPRFDIEEQRYYIFAKEVPALKTSYDDVQFDVDFFRPRVGDSTAGKFFNCSATSKNQNSSFQVHLEPRVRDFDNDTGEFFDEDRCDESEVGLLMNFDVTESGPTVEMWPTGDNARFVLEIHNKTLTIRVASTEFKSSQNTHEQEI